MDLEEISLLMGRVKKELDLLGLEQSNVAYMMPDPDHKVVQCRPLKPGYPIFNLVFGMGDLYDAVVGRVAEKLRVEPDRIKLTGHFCNHNEPNYQDTGYQFECLRHVLVGIHKIDCNVLYYDVACLPRKSKTVKVAYGGYPNAKQSCVAVRPDHIIVEDLLHDKEIVNLTNSNAKLRLVGTHEDAIFKVFSPEEKIENIPEYFTLRVEEIPKMTELGDCGHHLICVCNVTKTYGVHKISKRNIQKKCRGKGAPKKGQGRQANKPNKEMGKGLKGEDNVLDNRAKRHVKCTTTYVNNKPQINLNFY